MAPTAEIAGFWGTPTSTVDFCEPNYAVSHFVAEFWNAVTSIPIALVGLSGMVLSRRQQLGAEQFSCYAVVCIVGLGSIAFHATLMRTGQVLDEVPMLWVSLTLIYGACQHVRDRRFRRKVAVPSARRLALLGAGLAAYALIATSLYFSSGFETFVVMYGLSIALIVVLAATILFTERPAVGPGPKRLLATAACTYAGGFVLLWIPGEVLCHRVPLMQRLPMHAIFHLTSAAGPHLGLTAFALFRFDDEPKTRVAPSLAFAGLPTIRRDGLLGAGHKLRVA